jgi:hypothetical protein
MSQQHPGAHDFDFLFGCWHIENERLRSRLTASDEWDRFPAEHECWPILGGLGNVDTFRPKLPGSTFHGASVRLFNPETGLWSIYWADNVRCALFPPVLGRFVDGRAEFYGDDREGDRDVRVRFLWSDVSPLTALWEQAFSVDDGRTWETNWIMRFSRPHADHEKE